jgi:hypothetical protein
MLFEYRGFNIECATTLGSDGFVASATIWQAPAANIDRVEFTSGSLMSFSTQLQAVDYARVWAEMWCDEQLTPAWAATSPLVQRQPAKKPKAVTQTACRSPRARAVSVRR